MSDIHVHITAEERERGRDLRNTILEAINADILYSPIHNNSMVFGITEAIRTVYLNGDHTARELFDTVLPMMAEEIKNWPKDGGPDL